MKEWIKTLNYWSQIDAEYLATIEINLDEIKSQFFVQNDPDDVATLSEIL